MPEYNAPDVGGQTSSYPGDPNDYSYSSGFDWNKFSDTILNIIPGVLGGSAALYNATHNQQGQLLPYGAPGTIGYVPPQQNTTWLYVGGAIFSLILVIALVFLFTRK